ncbi:MAG: glycosyltransferase family 4 protein [Nitrososphaerota archaeon]|nr:glycosyltransferase family 4 protein [Nitrososphaerota archaeon]
MARPSVLFGNHLRLQSASTYRQVGFAKYLKPHGYDCNFLGRAPKEISATRDRPDQKVEWKSYFTDIEYWKEPIVQNFFSNVKFFSRICKNSSVVHVNRANPFTASVISLARSAPWRLVVDVEDWDGFGGYSSYADKYGPAGALLTFYEQVFPRTADAVIVVSHLLRSRMISAGVAKDRIFLIPNGFDPDLFHPGISGRKAREIYNLGDSPVVIYASTFWDFERSLHEIAMKAFKRILESVPTAKFVVVGSGNMAVQQIINEFGLEKHVVRTGFVPREMVPQLMAAADVALHVISEHPFHVASSPMIVPEYMAVGKPIVAPATGELSYMLRDGAGLLVDRADPDLLAEGVIKLLKDETMSKSIGEGALKVAAKGYCYKVLAEKLLEIYSQIN